MCTQLANPEYTYEYFQQDDVCRLCWNRSQAEPIHSKTDLLDKIADCLNIVITPHLPNNACGDCCVQVEKFYDFKKHCQNTDKKLQEIINNYLTEKKEGKSKFKYKSKRAITYCNVCMIECHTLDEYKNHIQNHGMDIHDIENHDINNHVYENRDITNQSIKNHGIHDLNVKSYGTYNHDLNNRGIDNLNIKSHGNDYHDINKQGIIDNLNIKGHGIDDCDINKHGDDNLNIKNHDINNHGIDNRNIENQGIDNGIKSPKIDKQAAHDYIHDNGNRKWKYKPKRTPTYCNVCMIDYQTIDKFKIHNIKNHGIDNGLFKCFGCEKSYKNRKSRFCHEKNFCKGLKDGYKCIICDRFLPKRSVFESHMRDHRKNVPIKLPDEMFQCQKCDKLFKTREDLNCHVEAEHEADKKNYVCESCGRVFSRKDYLNKHKLTHTGDKQHVCPHCDFRTIQRSSLIVHIRKHTGERPYTCSMCPQRCVSSSNLRAHLRRHMGLKMHECTICNKKFGYKVSLREHMTLHAPAQHACPHCSASYTRPRSLRRHLAGKHGEK